MAKQRVNIHSLVKKTLSNQNFSEFLWVYCRPSVADLFPKRRCGIYVLHFENNQYYVGQATDVTRRYAQHKKEHGDVQELAFCPLAITRLDAVEQSLIREFELRGIPLRNVNFTSIPTGESDLDLVCSADTQRDWESDLSTSAPSQTQILDEPDLRVKHSKRFLKLAQHKHFKSSILPFLVKYFTRCVLNPAETELTFWSLTCGTRVFLDASDITLARLNLFRCEVLTIWVDRHRNLAFSFHLTKSCLSAAHLRSLKLRSLRISDQAYETGGPDQFCIQVYGAENAMSLLEDDRVIRAIRTFNLRQMEKGPTIYRRYHCLNFAEAVLSQLARTAKDQTGSDV